MFSLKQLVPIVLDQIEPKMVTDMIVNNSEKAIDWLHKKASEQVEFQEGEKEVVIQLIHQVLDGKRTIVALICAADENCNITRKCGYLNLRELAENADVEDLKLKLSNLLLSE